jgi:hypothetical protein
MYCDNCGSPVSGNFCSTCGFNLMQIQAFNQPPIQQAYPQPLQPVPYQQGGYAPAYQQQRQPVYPPPKKGAGKVIAVLAIIIGTVLLLTGLFLYLPEPEEDYQEGFVVEMSGTDTMDIRAEGEIRGGEARQIREMIDSWIGDDDGEVTKDEVDEFMEQTGDQVGSNAYGFEINGDWGEYSKYNLKFKGIIGDVDSGDTISIISSFTIDWKYIDTDRYSYDLVFESTDEIYQDFRFICPPDYEIESVDGLRNEEFFNERTTVTGDLTYNEVEITIVKIGEEPIPSGSLIITDDPNVRGKYYGSFQGSVENEDIDIHLYDESSGTTMFMRQPNDGDLLQIRRGCNLTYHDSNQNEKLDAADTLIIQGGERGDMIMIVYRPTQDNIVSITIR